LERSRAWARRHMVRADGGYAGRASASQRRAIAHLCQVRRAAAEGDLAENRAEQAVLNLLETSATATAAAAAAASTPTKGKVPRKSASQEDEVVPGSYVAAAVSASPELQRYLHTVVVGAHAMLPLDLPPDSDDCQLNFPSDWTSHRRSALTLIIFVARANTRAPFATPFTEDGKVEGSSRASV
jgi:hypothetical protein